MSSVEPNVKQPVERSAGWAGPEAVTAAVRLLEGLADVPLHDHPEIYQRIHASLQDALAGVDGA